MTLTENNSVPSGGTEPSRHDGADHRTDRPDTAVDAVLYDFGNVLVGWEPRGALRRGLTPRAVETFLHEVDFDAFNRRQDAGRTWAEGIDDLRRSRPEHVHGVETYLTHFADSLTGPVEGSAALVEDLEARGLRLYGLTNWSAELFHHAALAAPATLRMRDVLVSGREGLAKPDPQIFRLAIERFGLVPERTVFVDDSPANVAAAASLGLVAVRFETTDGFRRDLRALGVEVPPPVARP
ncbi:HAD family phosphatase [Cellulomonas sp. PhB143]|uniref:HAD family hydrolase n=1 Tax=Cellulomonas sp. PhB143 TaxID=2485186 RepID=UPI000FAEC574|nr:HAD family phosphatase [Cellulomonas sp. PhB143]ROS74521.1 2-haloacid dehalogenase [Cellulomonas sp. PhB143]